MLAVVQCRHYSSLPMRSPTRIFRPSGRRSWLAFILALAGCAGPLAIYSAIRPTDQEAYEEHVMYTSEPEAKAFVAWRAEQRGQSQGHAAVRGPAVAVSHGSLRSPVRISPAI